MSAKCHSYALHVTVARGDSYTHQLLELMPATQSVNHSRHSCAFVMLILLSHSELGVVLSVFMSDNNTHTDGSEPTEATDITTDTPTDTPESVDTVEVSIAQVSISHTTNAIASLGEIRAETADEAVTTHLSATARPSTEGGSAKLVLARDSVIIPHTEAEATALKTARQALAEAITADSHGDIIRCEEQVRKLDTYNLNLDVVNAVVRPVESDEDGVITFNGGTIAQSTDFCVRIGDQVRSCISKHGKIASWVRNREAIAPAVNRAVAERRKRVQDCEVTQDVVKSLTSHEDTKVMDTLDIVNWTSDDDGVDVGYKVEYHTSGFDKVLKGLAPQLEGTAALLAFGSIA